MEFNKATLKQNILPRFGDYFQYKHAFTDEHIERTHSMIYDNNIKFHKGQTGPEDAKEAYSSNNRDIAYVEVANYSMWIYEYLEGAVIHANEQMFNFNIDYVTDPLHYVIYPEPNKVGATGEMREKGGFLHWHMDLGIGNTSRRKLATIVQLSDPNDYEGGELHIFTGGDPTVYDEKLIVQLDKGDVVVFPSFYMHQLTPVTRGERRSLVYWTGGTPFK